MSSDDWYRRTTWTDTDRSEFHARLKRSRGDFHKAQYLRIQAHYLANANLIQGAVELLDQSIVDFPDPSQLAQAHLQYAECMLASDRVDDAVIAYRRAFDAEQAYPNSRSQLWLDFPWLIVTRGLSDLFSEIDTFLDWANETPRFPSRSFGSTPFLHSLLTSMAMPTLLACTHRLLFPPLPKNTLAFHDTQPLDWQGLRTP